MRDPEPPDELDPTLVVGGPRPLASPTAGARLGRYLVIDELGRGGVGVVVRAYDPKLQREVALKCVRPDRATAGRQDRLLREAQALARLSHPNVVAVYDVELIDDIVVIAMELVDGLTMLRWLGQHGGDPDELRAALVAAGRGLVAAHHAGLLHRDFKPGNVLVARGGAVKVMDFGLAEPVTDVTTPSTDPAASEIVEIDVEHDASASSSSASSSSAMVVGTPAYMPPEQHAGLPLTEAADQYAFCVSAWQVLTGELPFRPARRGLRALHDSKAAGPPPWPRAIAMPRRVVDALRRGLEPDLHARWPSMEALLAEIEPDRGRGRRSLAIVVALTVVAGAATTWLAARRHSDPPCSGAEAQLVGVWDPERRDAIDRAVLATGVPYAASLRPRIAEGLDDYARAWAAMHTESCTATTVRGEQSSEVMDLQMACLRRAKVELGATVDALAAADLRTVGRAHQLVGELPALARCADIDALRAPVAPPADPERRAEVRALEDVLASGRTHQRLGDYASARTVVDEIAARVAAVDHPPLTAGWALLASEGSSGLGAYADAEPLGQQALRAALGAHDWDTAIRAAQQLTRLVGSRLRRTAEAHAYVDVALALTEGLGDAREAVSHECLGDVLIAEGKYGEAELAYRRALTILDRDDHGDALAVADAHAELGLALLSEGRYAEAEAEHRFARDVREHELGAEHPDVAKARNNLANAYFGEARYDLAEAEHRAVLELRLRTLGPDHADVAASHNNLGNALFRQGRLDEAEAEHRLALAGRERSLGPRHPEVGWSHNNLANVAFTRGDNDTAEAEYRRAIELWTDSLGPDHPDIGAARSNLGNTLAIRHAFVESEAEHRRALATRARALGPMHPDLGASHLGIGNALLGQGRIAEALLEYRRALVIDIAALGGDHPDTARVHINIGHALGRRGDWMGAEIEYRASLAARERSLGPDHPDIADSAIRLGETLEHLGRTDEALAMFLRARSIDAMQAADASARADLDFAIARVSWSRPGERARARALAEAALRVLQDDPTRVAMADEARTWLAQHR